MPKYLLEANYTLHGIKGVKSIGGSARQADVEAAVASVGGHVDGFYFAFGSTDVFVVADFPDNVSAAAVALAVGAAGGAVVRTVALLTPAEIDEAARRNVDYRSPVIGGLTWG